jgi:hypothetical protein
MLGTLGILGVNVKARDPGQRIVGHCELSDNRLEVEYGSRQRSKQTQGSVVGLVPDSEARAVPRRSRENRESSIRLWTVDYLLRVVGHEEGLFLEQSHKAVNISSVWVHPTNCTTNATSSVAILSTVSKLTKYITSFMNGSAAVCSGARVSGEVPFAV